MLSLSISCTLSFSGFLEFEDLLRHGKPVLDSADAICIRMLSKLVLPV